MKLPSSLRFEAIGTAWQIDTIDRLPEPLVARIHSRIDDFDRTYSRFRSDSLVSRIASEPGVYRFPDDAAPLFDLYRRLYEATDGSISPLVGRALENLGYDRAYSLRPTGEPPIVPRWQDSIAWDGHQLTAIRPVVIDVGGAGKGYLADIVGELIADAGIPEFIVDASGDLVHRGSDGIRVGLEHPLDATKAIGVARLHNQSLCASATNRRAWGNGIHHIIDATTGLPARDVIATWAIASTGLLADGLATALFRPNLARLVDEFEFEYVRMFADGRVECSPSLDGELFT